MTDLLIPIVLPAGGSAKESSHKLCWQAVNNIVRMLFGMSKEDLDAYIETNQNKMSMAELAVLANAKDPRMIWAILDRVLGKATQTVEVENKALTHADIMKQIEEMRNESNRKLQE